MTDIEKDYLEIKESYSTLMGALDSDLKKAKEEKPCDVRKVKRIEQERENAIIAFDMVTSVYFRLLSHKGN